MKNWPKNRQKFVKPFFLCKTKKIEAVSSCHNFAWQFYRIVNGHPGTNAGRPMDFDVNHRFTVLQINWKRLTTRCWLSRTDEVLFHWLCTIEEAYKCPSVFVGSLRTIFKFWMCYPPASEASREVANLTERKNPHTPVHGVKNFVRLSVINFNPNYLRTGKTEWANKKFGHLLKHKSYYF